MKKIFDLRTSGLRFFTACWNTSRVFLVQWGRTGNYVHHQHRENVTVGYCTHLLHQYRSQVMVPTLIVPRVIPSIRMKRREIKHHRAFRPIRIVTRCSSFVGLSQEAIEWTTELVSWANVNVAIAIVRNPSEP